MNRYKLSFLDKIFQRSIFMCYLNNLLMDKLQTTGNSRDEL